MPAPLFMCRHTWLNRFGLITAVTVGWADNRKSACGAAAGQALAAIRAVKRRFAGASSAGRGMLGGQRLSPQQRHAVGSTLSTPMPNPV